MSERQPNQESSREMSQPAPHGRHVLVTGGAGFIGSHVVRRFLDQGDDVTVIDDLSSGDRNAVPRGAHFLQMDIGSSSAARLIKESRFDVICHLAAQIDVRASVADPGRDCTVNVIGTLNLLEAVLATGRPTRFIFASSGGAIYGEAEAGPVNEDSSKHPISPYGISKLAVEHYISYYAEVRGLDAITLRFANVYGPGQGNGGEGGVVSIFAQRLRDGRPIIVYGSGDQTRDYIYVTDVAEAHLQAAIAVLPPSIGVDGRAFNIGTGIETDVLTLADQMAAVSGCHPMRLHEPPRPGELMRSAVCPEKAYRVLGWAPVVPLRLGLEKTIRWFLDARPASMVAGAR
jgi:UDP-glucose 4-epimerase